MPDYIPLPGSTFQDAVEISDDEDSPTLRTPKRTGVRGNDDSGDKDCVELSSAQGARTPRPLEQRPRLGAGERFLNSVRAGSLPNITIVVPNKCYQLYRHPNPHDPLEVRQKPTILLVKYIIRQATGAILVYGIMLKRNCDIHLEFSETGDRLFTILPRLRNELCMHLQTTPGRIGSSLNGESLIPLPLSRIEREREVVFTNRLWPEYNYQCSGLNCKDYETDEDDPEMVKFVEEHAVLVCRSKYTEELEHQGRKSKPVAWQLVPLNKAECDDREGLEDVTLRRQTERDREKRRAKHPAASTNIATTSGTRRKPIMGDICAGAGGVLQAAITAGLKPRLALDNWNVAIESLRKNFSHLSDIEFLHMGVEDVKTLSTDLQNLIVDILHVSYPCTGFSYANRRQNPDRDDISNDLTMSLEHVLATFMPRMVSMEQTPAIATRFDGIYFRTVIRQLVESGYGVRWSRPNMANFRVPQKRKRYMVLGFKRGEKMPNWPRPTGEMTVREAISNIPLASTLHDIEEQKRKFRNRRNRTTPRQINLDEPLPKIIMTNGVEGVFKDRGEYHQPTIRQQLSLTTLPNNFTLAGDNQKDLTKQIGNMVPHNFMVEIFRELKKALHAGDGETEQFEKNRESELNRMRLRGDTIMIDG